MNNVIRERRYPVNKNTILWQLLFPWNFFQTCLQSKNNKSTAKFGKITFFSLRISTGTCMIVTVSKTGMGPNFVKWATRFENGCLRKSPRRCMGATVAHGLQQWGEKCEFLGYSDSPTLRFARNPPSLCISLNVDGHTSCDFLVYHLYTVKI